MLPTFYFVEKKLSLFREQALFKDINNLYTEVKGENDFTITDFTEFKEKFVEKRLNLIHFSLSKAECPIEFSDLTCRIITNCWFQKNTPHSISFGLYFLYFFYCWSPLKKRIKFSVCPEVLEVMMDEKVWKDSTYAFVLNKVRLFDEIQGFLIIISWFKCNLDDKRRNAKFWDKNVRYL